MPGEPHPRNAERQIAESQVLDLGQINGRSPSRTDQESAEDVVDVLGRIQKLSRAVNPEVIRHLQDDLQHTLAQYEKLDHSSLAPALRKRRALIDAILDECSHLRQRQQLFEIPGATSGVLGYVAVGRGDFPLARAYCLEAFQLGDFAQDANLQAWARGLQSFCEYYAGRYDEALCLAEDGLRYARSGPQTVRLTVNGVARALGKLGDAEGVHRTVDEAYDLMSRNDVPSGVPSSIAFECYSTAQTASNAATAYVSLGMPEKVQHYVGLALPDISKSDSPWSRSLVMIDLALSLIRSREAGLDRAAGLVLDALGISAGRPVISVQQRTSEFVSDATGAVGKYTSGQCGCRRRIRYESPFMGGMNSSGSPDCANLEELERFRNLRWLRNHWSRPIGPRAYYWYLTFEDSPELRSLARECQKAIAFPYYDLTPPYGLHLSLDRIAFDGDITLDQLGAIEAAAIRACREIPPFDITIDSLGGTPGAIGFTVSPAQPIRDLRDAFRAAGTVGLSGRTRQTF